MNMRLAKAVLNSGLLLGVGTDEAKELLALARDVVNAYGHQQDDLLTPQDYKDAMTCQSACNTSGVVRSLERMLRRVVNESRRLNKGTDWCNQHPIVRLMTEQLRHLANTMSYSAAYNAADAIEKHVSGDAWGYTHVVEVTQNMPESPWATPVSAAPAREHFHQTQGISIGKVVGLVFRDSLVQARVAAEVSSDTYPTVVAETAFYTAVVLERKDDGYWYPKENS